MMKNIILALFGFGLIGCSTDVVKEGASEEDEVSVLERSERKPETDYEFDPKKNSKELQNGLLINWRFKSDGPAINRGDVVNINYEVRLMDSALVESNQNFGLKSYPFMVGFGLQTEGWDLALSNLNVGDSVEIFIPAALGRGEKGYKERDKYSGEIKEIIPPNSDLILILKAESLEAPLREVDGNKVWRLLENKNNAAKFDEGKTIDFHCMVSTPTNPMYINTFRNKPPFTLKLEDSGVVPGLKKALIGSKEGDRLYIYVPADQAYKSKGFQEIVKPDEPLFYNVMVMNVQ
jgi:FKBP-type peptidyl-prolyl cis-trans isomerase